MSSITDLISEAERQLTVCNACRYCEGYCAVFPSLARRSEFSPDEVSHFSNLCHDCRACYYACMYSPPHEFAVNLPQILDKVRLESYDRYLGPVAKWCHRHLNGIASLSISGVLSLAFVGGVAAASNGGGAIFREHKSGSPYSVIAYAPLVAVVLVPFIISLWVMIRSAMRYWSATRGPIRMLWNCAAIAKATNSAAQLRNLKGGGGDCYYSGDSPSAARRRFHGAIAYGFSLCVISTVAAGIMQDVLGMRPPYGIPSVPVVCGLIGGVGLVIGCTGLIALKVRSDPALAYESNLVAEFGLLGALDLLAATGLLTLFTRHDAIYGVILIVHLSAVVACFAYAPYTKFVHFIYRYLALVKDSIERQVVLEKEASEIEIHSTTA